MSDGPKDPTPEYLLEDTPAFTIIQGGKGGRDGAGGTQPPPAGKKLTAKQERYADNIIKGMTQSAAYREAYDAENMSNKAIWNEASWLAGHPGVAMRVKAGKRRVQESAVHTGLSLRLHVEERLFQLSQRADTDAACIRATELLGKLDTVQAFKERISTDQTDETPDEVRAALEAKLRSAFTGT